jgi:hypothetical protein
VHGADEDRAAAGDQRAEPGPHPAASVQQQAGGDDRVDDQAEGGGIDLAGQRPADRVVPDYMVEVVAQRHRRRQVGQTVQGPAVHRSILGC